MKAGERAAAAAEPTLNCDKVGKVHYKLACIVFQRSVQSDGGIIHFPLTLYKFSNLILVQHIPLNAATALRVAIFNYLRCDNIPSCGNVLCILCGGGLHGHWPPNQQELVRFTSDNFSWLNGAGIGVGRKLKLVDGLKNKQTSGHVCISRWENKARPWQFAYSLQLAAGTNANRKFTVMLNVMLNSNFSAIYIRRWCCCLQAYLHYVYVGAWSPNDVGGVIVWRSGIADYWRRPHSWSHFPLCRSFCKFWLFPLCCCLAIPFNIAFILNFYAGFFVL